MKTDFPKLKKLIEGMGDDDYLMDHDLNLTILNPNLRTAINANLDTRSKLDVSRFLTMAISFSENGSVDDEVTSWSEVEYKSYLTSVDISEEEDKEFVERFLKRIHSDFF